MRDGSGQLRVGILEGMRAPRDIPGDEPPRRPRVNGGRLWGGGFATAVVAALIVLVGVYIARHLLDIAVLAPKAAGSLGSSTTAVYAVIAALCALVATALLHVLLLGAPRPLSFFAWITALAVVIAVIAPFSEMADLESKAATAIINLIAGVAVISLLTGVGGGSTTQQPPPPAGYPRGLAGRAATR